MRWNDKVEEGKTYRQVCEFHYEEGDTLIDVQSDKFVENGVQYKVNLTQRTCSCQKCHFKRTLCLTFSTTKHFNEKEILKINLSAVYLLQ